jgi:hypothetical protein
MAALLVDRRPCHRLCPAAFAVHETEPHQSPTTLATIACFARLRPVMRRLLLVFLMVLLPLQWTWATAARVCAHEQVAASAHVGHHEHQHEKAERVADQPDAGQPGALSDHPDCGVCHGMCSAVAPAHETMPTLWTGRNHFVLYASEVPDRFLDTLLRPPLTTVS